MMYTAFVYATYILGIVLLFCSAGSVLLYMGANRNGNWLTVAYRLAVVALASLIVTGGLRAFQWKLVPYTTAVDSLCLFTTLSLAVIMVQLAVFSSHRALLCFYLPALSLIGVLSLFTAYPALSVAPKELSSGLLIAHVGLVFLAFALFFLAGLNGVAYVFQAHRLKHRKTTGLFQRLPSLDALDKNLFQLIRAGYPTFVVTLIVGGFWVWYEGDKLSPTWWISPKVAMSVPMLLFYAFTFHARAIGWLRGPKLAYLVCYGTAALIGFYLVLTLLGAQDHNFYGAAG
ncbi:MAG: cytochrome c biogenesis protein CcsA [Candidatus Hydrogenedentes bacterium]|nr:cytochrome c biogenesis protein CcsA [Candidatus Hydrogenedentota bacterium]